MISKYEILTISNELQLLPSVIEKDYVISWFLYGLSQHQILSQEWLFKGGTCLKKCYFKDYRFSEDLDFTVLAKLEEIKSTQKYLAEIIHWISSNSGIKFLTNKIVFEKHTNKQNIENAQAFIYYGGPLASTSRNKWPRLKIDLTYLEHVCFSPSYKRVIHNYSDEVLGMSVNCYSYEEIFAEKIRALIERTRPRDLYDVIHLYNSANNFQIDISKVVSCFKDKCTFKKIERDIEKILESNRQSCNFAWGAQLSKQLVAIPDFEQYWSMLETILRDILRSSLRPLSL